MANFVFAPTLELLKLPDVVLDAESSSSTPTESLTSSG